MPSVIKFNKKRRRSFFKINFIDVRFISTTPLTVWSSLRFAICVNVMFYLCINGNPSTLHWPSIDYKILWLYDGWSQWHKKYELRAKTLKAVFKKAMNLKCMHYSVFSTCNTVSGKTKQAHTDWRALQVLVDSWEGRNSILWSELS